MKRGDKEIICFKSHKALEIILDNLDAQPQTDTATPQAHPADGRSYINQASWNMYLERRFEMLGKVEAN